MKIVIPSGGLLFLAGVPTVRGFIPYAVMPTKPVRSFNLPSRAHVSRTSPISRFQRHPRSEAGCALFMSLGTDSEQHNGPTFMEKERPLRQMRGLLGLRRLNGCGKVALLSFAAAATSQILPLLAVADEGAYPLASSALDGTLMESLTNSGFFQAFSLVFVSEIGDKTFFIAALLAAKTSRLISFAGSVGALAVMTVLAVALGLAFHSVPSTFTSGLPVDDIIAAAAFLYFGLITLKDAYELPSDSNEGIEEEKAEAEESVKEVEGKKTVWALILQTFSLVFAAEFGDRSFLTTIALGAAQSPVGVATGAIAAHASATGIAVTGGAYLSQFISEKVIGYIGGTLFVIFAVTTALGLF